MINKLFSGDYRKYTVITLIMTAGAFGLGFLWHFLFEITSKVGFIGIFAPVNESTWEHLKVLYFPFVISMILEYFLYGKEAYNFFSSKLIGITAGMLFTIAGFYTAVGAFGINNMAVNIGIYTGALVMTYLVSYFRMLKTPRLAGGGYESLAIVILAVYLIFFAIFTYFPPRIPLFRDPMTMRYSII